MLYFIDAAITFTDYNGKFPVPTDANFLVNSMINLFECFIHDFRCQDGEEDATSKLPKEIDEIVNQALLFALIWSIGGALDEHSRPKFDVFLQELLAGEDIAIKYKLDMPDFTAKKFPAKMGEFKSLFEMYYDRSKLMWVNWLKTLP